MKMNPIKFEGEITNEDAGELSDKQKELLLGVIEKWIEKITGNFIEGLIGDNYLPDGDDTNRVIEFVSEEGFEIEIKEK
jgi:hypothetical protein